MMRMMMAGGVASVLAMQIGCANADCEKMEAASQACLEEYEASGDTDSGTSFGGSFTCEGSVPVEAEACVIDAYENADCTNAEEVQDANFTANGCMTSAALDVFF